MARPILRCAVVALLATLLVPSMASGASAKAQAAAAPGEVAAPSIPASQLFGWGFDMPMGEFSDGQHLFVANYVGNTVVEVNSSDGTYVRTFAGSFSGPCSVASDGVHLWVGSCNFPSLVELNLSDGTLVKKVTLSGEPMTMVSHDGTLWVVSTWTRQMEGVIQIDEATGDVLSSSVDGLTIANTAAYDNGYLWVGDYSGNLVRVNTSDPSDVHTFNGFGVIRGVSPDGLGGIWVYSGDGILRQVNEADGSVNSSISTGAGTCDDVMNCLDSVFANGTSVWTSDWVGGVVKQWNAATGELVASSTSARYPGRIVGDASGVWVTDSSSNSVIGFDATSGLPSTVIGGSDYKFDQPCAIDADGVHVWVKNCWGGGTVTEMNEADGSLVGVLSGNAHQFGDSSTATDGTVSWNGTHYWESDGLLGAILENDVATGNLLDVFTYPNYAVDNPTAMLFADGNLWVTNENGSSVLMIQQASPPAQVSATPVSDGVAVSWSDGGMAQLARRSASAKPTTVRTSWGLVKQTPPVTSHTVTAKPGGAKCTTTGTSCTITNLSPDTGYSFSVTSNNAVGSGNPSVAVSATPAPATPPSAPTITSVTRGNAQATVAWTDGASNGSPIQSYKLYVYSGSTLVQTKTNCTGPPCVVTGLANGTAYTFKVSDVNGVGEGALSLASTAVTPATTPGAPTSVSAVRGNTQATVTWTGSSTNGGSTETYTVQQAVSPYSSWSNVSGCTSLIASTLTCSATGLTNGTNYKFRVVAINTVGTTYSNPSGVVTPIIQFSVGIPGYSSVPSSCVFHGAGKYIRPDASCVPGALNPNVTQANIQSTICVAGWTDTVRPSSSWIKSLKIAQMATWGIIGSTSTTEEDHLIPLELGGAPKDSRNLWPEIGGIPNKKDTLENRLKTSVCNGTLTLAEAQSAIGTDWAEAYVLYVGPAT